MRSRSCLFVALSSSAYAATGDGFILGQPNTADKPTTLTGTTAGAAALKVANTAAQPAANFTAPAGVAPFSVSGSAKVAKLNADLVDGVDSSAFLRSTGTAINAQNLGGVSASEYVRGFAGAVAVAKGSNTFDLANGFVPLRLECGLDIKYQPSKISYTNATDAAANIFIDDGLGVIDDGVGSGRFAEPVYFQEPARGTITRPYPSKVTKSITVQAQGAGFVQVTHIAYAYRATDCHIQWETNTWYF